MPLHQSHLGRHFTSGLLALALAATAVGPACRRSPIGPAASSRGSRSPAGAGLLRDPTGSPLKSPLDAKDTAGAKQRFVEILRRTLNGRITDPARQGRWDFWSDASSLYQLPDGTSAWLMSFRRTSSTSQEGYLVLGTIFGQNTVVRGHWRVDAGIDDIHVIDMGKAGRFIYTVSFDTTSTSRKIFHHLLHFDGHAIRAVWSYRLDYDVLLPSTYEPVSVTFRDEDRDGTREVRLRIPGKKTPHMWKHRWALFKWSPPRNEFLPFRNLAFTPVSKQKPLWAAFGFLEAIRKHARAHLRRFATDRRRCLGADELYEAMTGSRYKILGPPRRKPTVRAHGPNRASALVDLERPGDARRYMAELELVRTSHQPNSWAVCRIRFFRL